jgi:polyhydroxyalkanoate synthase
LSAARDSLKKTLDRKFRGQLAAVTGGLAPDDYAKAWWDWSLNLTKTPAKQLELAQSAMHKVLDTVQFAVRAASGSPMPPVEGDVNGNRFADETWSRWPFNVFARAYQNAAGWSQEALTTVPGVTARNTLLLEFISRQLADATSPTNFLLTNPEILEATRAEHGRNLARGFKHWVEDAARLLKGGKTPGTERFRVGQDVAATPGQVVYRNRLIELIQYSPQTETVHPEPILIVPAWIMKYYILDLSPRNSLVRYLLEQGHTVFVASWKNPTAADRALGMDDYLRLGVREALDAVSAIVPEHPVHAVGYCIGGTLLAIAAAALGAERDQRLASVTLFAAQTDFSEPGELAVFISPSQLAMLEAVMHEAGVLESQRMGAAFALLRSSDLLWNPAVKTYLRGEREELNDLMAWNADGTRMPWCMHSEYLQRLYLENALATGRFEADGKKIDLADIRVPMFVVGTETDHVAPWRSVYKVRGLTRSPDFTFLLTSGGHNAGIVSGPVHPKRRHRVLTWNDAETTLTPDAWLEQATQKAGSWWPTWQQWLVDHSSTPRVAPPPVGNAAAGLAPLAQAPGEYVHG